MRVKNNQDNMVNYLRSNSQMGAGGIKTDPLLAGTFCHAQNKNTQVRDAHTINRMLAADNQLITMPQNNLITQSIEYANSLQTARGSSKNTANILKKLKYDFKGISMQIMRSKTSTNAKQVAGKARREVLRLKREKQNGNYDEEEIQAAISHAQAMERVAKKKVRNLQLEEMIHVDDEETYGTVDPLEDLNMARMYDHLMDGFMGEMNESVEEINKSMEEMNRSMEEMNKTMEEMNKTMEEMLEESGLSELAQGLMDIPDQNMSPEDYKMYKQKHRLEEMKAMAKADAEYLKAVFERYQTLRSAGGPTAAESGIGTGSIAPVSAGTAGVANASPVVDVCL